MKLCSRFRSSLIILLCGYLPFNLVTGETLGYVWPTDSVLFHIGNLNGADDLWKDAFEEGAKRWNDAPTSFQFLTERTSGIGFCTSTGNNSVQFSTTFCGDDWGSTTLAVTRAWHIGSTTNKTDIIFNKKKDWDVYDGVAQFYAHDFRRVAVHEMGHSAGLAHPIATDVIMSAVLNDIYLPALDDINSLRGIYGETTHTLTLENSGDGVISVAPLVSGTGVVSDNIVFTSNYGSFLDCNAPVCQIPIQHGLRLIIEAHPNTSNGVELANWSGTETRLNSVELTPFVSDRTLTAHYSIGFDADEDLVADNVDNCPVVVNADQINTDGDSAGDACDAFPNDPAETLDSDGDGVGDNADVFPNDPTETLDSDDDGVGDNVDVFPNDPAETLDSDGDGVGNNADALPNDPTETLDSDDDGVGDNADVFPNDPAETLDSDGDGVGNNADAFPGDPAETLDSDDDGVGDNADAFPNDPTETLDSDSDGVGDNADNCPVIRNVNQLDADADRQGNLCDLDDDNDGVPDTVDALPLNSRESIDTDGDGIGNNADTDDDNDGVPDTVDALPLNAGENVDTDGDGIGNSADTDDDNDGVPDVIDALPLNADESVDTDGDGVGNNTDSDDDSDGVPDDVDALPLNAGESVDTDGDDTGNNADMDDDNDGVLDDVDAFPLNAAESIDTDGDGTGNNADTDDDNDGVFDAADAFPLDSTKSVVESGDGGDSGGGAVSLLGLGLFSLLGFARRKV